RNKRTFVGPASDKKNRTHPPCLSDENRFYIIQNKLNRVVNCQSRRNRSTRTVDVQRNVALWILSFQEQQLRRDQVGYVVIDRCSYKDDAVTQQPRIDVVRAFAAIGLFNHHRDQSVVFVVHSTSCFSTTILKSMHRWVNE